MVRALRWFAVASTACVLFGCPKKNAATDGGADDGAAAVAAEAAAAPAAAAANEASVTRYPDETAVNHVSQTTRWTTSNIRTQAGNNAGDLVAVVKAGTDVDKIAERQGYYLVIFTDPSDATRKEMGWVSQAVFTPEPPHKHTAAHCTGGMVPILLQGGEEQCVAGCVTDANCQHGSLCNGAGVLSVNGTPGAQTKFCGPAPGTVTVPDAGGAPPAVVDAGGGPTPPGPKKLDVKLGADGKCPAGYGTCGAICRLHCAKDADCGVTGAKCTASFCVGPGAAPCK
jgi:hypothetical protein